jgi:hypothetical protein
MGLFPIRATGQRSFHQLPLTVTFILRRKEFSIVRIESRWERINGRSSGGAEDSVNIRQPTSIDVFIIQFAITVQVPCRVTWLSSSPGFLELVAANFTPEAFFQLPDKLILDQIAF